MKTYSLKLSDVLTSTGLLILLTGCAFHQPLDQAPEKHPPAVSTLGSSDSRAARESQAAEATVYHAAQLLTGEARRKARPTLISGQCFVQSPGSNILTPCPRMYLQLLSERGVPIRKILVKNGSFTVDIRRLKTFQLVPVSDQYKVESGSSIGSEHMGDERGLKIKLLRTNSDSDSAAPGAAGD